MVRSATGTVVNGRHVVLRDFVQTLHVLLRYLPGGITYLPTMLLYCHSSVFSNRERNQITSNIGSYTKSAFTSITFHGSTEGLVPVDAITQLVIFISVWLFAVRTLEVNTAHADDAARNYDCFTHYLCFFSSL